MVGVPSEKVTISTLPIHFNKVLTDSHGGDGRDEDCRPAARRRTPYSVQDFALAIGAWSRADEPAGRSNRLQQDARIVRLAGQPKHAPGDMAS